MAVKPLIVGALRSVIPASVQKGRIVVVMVGRVGGGSAIPSDIVISDIKTLVGQ